MFALLAAACCLLTGTVHSPSGAPISDAQIALHGKTTQQTTSDARGEFSMQTNPGTYRLDAMRRGFAPVSVSPVVVNGDTKVEVVLDPADSPKLRTIGSVTVNGGFTLQRNAIPEVDVSREQMDALGYTNVIESLGQVPSLVLQHPDAGAATAPSVVSLRGPDPSEALVTLDGHPLNDGNTGDADISQFAVPAFNSVNVTEGLGPSDSEISNTFGGAVNFVSLQPTQTPHFNFSGSVGSFGTTQTWLNATGTSGKLGYAFAGNDFQQAGQVDENALVTPLNNTPIDCSPAMTNCPVLTHLGSSISSRLGVANLQYNFSEQSDAGLRLFSLGDTRDESSALNGVAGNAFTPCDETSTVPCTTGFTSQPNPNLGQHIGAGSAMFSQSIRAYDGYSRSVLGSGSLLADFFADDNNVDFTGGSTGATPYDVSHLDKRYIEALSWGRAFDTSEFSFGGYLRQESLAGQGIEQTQTQDITSYFLRGGQQFGKLHVSGGVYDANYSTFGSSLDWRLGTSYDLDSTSAVRASVGTGFRAPLLIERYYFPEVVVGGKVQPNPALPPADANCVVPGQGDPNEKAEHATEYELGYSKLFSSVSNLDVSLYRSNLRDTIENYYPGYSCNAPNGFAYEIPINIGNAVYEGAEVRFKQSFPRQNLLMVVSYGLNVAYPYALGSNVSNPTSGGTLVDGQQFLGVPQQQGSMSLDWAHNGWHAATALTFAGRNNPLHQAPYTLTDAAVGKTLGRFDLTLAATNIFNAVSGPFTIYGAGVPYQGLYASSKGGTYLANVPTDQLNVMPASVRLIFTLHE
ncbi:MAG TPA: TonB-dependent receptor [Candidatus Baltobacteraceae bacterium]|nr:TonB-dependent receptor [Candidatus Baltobacteraceae bacterium]